MNHNELKDRQVDGEMDHNVLKGGWPGTGRTYHWACWDARFDVSLTNFSILGKLIASDEVDREMDLDIVFLCFVHQTLHNLCTLFVIQRWTNLQGNKECNHSYVQFLKNYFYMSKHNSGVKAGVPLFHTASVGSVLAWNTYPEQTPHKHIIPHELFLEHKHHTNTWTFSCSCWIKHKTRYADT